MKEDPRSTTPGPSMILAAAILLFGISSSAKAASTAWFNQQSEEAQTTSSSPAPQASQPQTTPADAGPAEPKPATAESPAKAKSANPKTTKTTHRKKKPVKSGCEAAPAANSNASAASAGSTPTQTDATPADPKPCTPPKIVIRQGGTSEPSIQLAGPGGNQASQKRVATNQMLGITEGNLKKISALQLNSTQQGTVSQIKQFVGQSRAALDAGDLERANTLAWKAELLSEDLLKPQQ